MQQPMTKERIEALERAYADFKHPEAGYLRVHGGDYFDLIEALKMTRAVLEELAGIQDSQGWTTNMAARVALHKLDGKL